MTVLRPRNYVHANAARWEVLYNFYYAAVSAVRSATGTKTEVLCSVSNYWITLEDNSSSAFNLRSAARCSILARGDVHVQCGERSAGAACHASAACYCRDRSGAAKYKKLVEEAIRKMSPNRL